MKRFAAGAVVACIIALLISVLTRTPEHGKVPAAAVDSAPGPRCEPALSADTDKCQHRPRMKSTEKAMALFPLQASHPIVITEVVPTSEPPHNKHLLNAEHLPPELLEKIWASSREYQQGNYDHAALIALDALDSSDNFPQAKIVLHGGAGLCYEKLGYTRLAMEQYRQALAQDPGHRISHAGMRRLDPEFAARHPELSRVPAQ